MKNIRRGLAAFGAVKAELGNSRGFAKSSEIYSLRNKLTMRRSGPRAI
jgi:hypothetical protein